MRKNIVYGLLAACLFAAAVPYASAQESLFKAALERGRNSNGCYTFQSTGKKGYDIDAVRRTAQKKDYILAPKYESAQVSKFGDVAHVVSSFDFYPKEDFLAYMFFSLSKGFTGAYPKYEDLVNRGSAYLYFEEDRNNKDRMFYHYDNILWSGNVEDGLLSGKGRGIVSNDTWVCCFDGEFEEGCPVGLTEFRWVAWNQAYSFFNSDGTYSANGKSNKVYNYAFTAGHYHDGMVWFKKGSQYGFLNAQKNAATSAYIRPEYKSVISDFSGGVAAVTRSNGEEILIDKNGQFVDYTDAQKQKNLEAERKKQEEARLAQIRKEQEEQERLLAIQMENEMKRDCVGRKIAWKERISYDTSGGGIGGLLLSAAGLGSTDYDIEYTAIVESMIGDTAVKAIVSNARIISPGWASANWLKYQSIAQEEAYKAVGQTRVKELSEFYLVK